MKRLVLMVTLFALLASSAGAQMMGGGRGTPGQSPMTPGSGFGGMFGGRGEMAPQSLFVSPQGNAIVVRVVDSNNDGVLEPELVALTPAGTRAWSKALGRRGLLGLFNDLLLLVEPPATDATAPFATTLIALDTTSGVERWSLAVDGIPMNAQPFAGGMYLTVINHEVPDPTAPARGRFGSASPALWAVNQAGVVLWKYDLKQ